METDDTRNPDRVRKSWFLALTQDRDLVDELGPVWGLPKNGKTLLLFEDDVIAFVRYLAEAQDLVGFDESAMPYNVAAVEFEESLPARKKKSTRTITKRTAQTRTKTRRKTRPKTHPKGKGRRRER